MSLRRAHAGELGLHPIDQMAEDPPDAPDGLAMRGHALLAGQAAPTRGDGENEHPVALLQAPHCQAGLDDRPYRLMPKDAPGNVQAVTGR